MEHSRLFVLVSCLPSVIWSRRFQSFRLDQCRPGINQLTPASYTMIAVFPALYFGYKFVRKTKIHKPEEVDLHKDLDVIAEYERNYVPIPPK